MTINTVTGPPDARVVQTPHGFHVLPRDVFKRSGDDFKLLNNSGSTVRVTFPVLPMQPPLADIPPGRVQVFTILDTAPDIYDYRVEVSLTDRTRDFTLRASGGSDPRIIIDF